MTPSTSRAPNRELLEASHSFPGDYLIKAFGPASTEFRHAVTAAVVDVRVQVSERVSSKGNSICITLCLSVQTVDEVIHAYDRLHDVPDLKMIL